MYNIESILEASSWVTYDVQKLKNPILLWAHPEAVKNLPNGETFCDRFGYADSSATCFDSVQFDIRKNIAVAAERYGGYGIGQNGGGGRCGNVHGVQLKGIGPNCLVGVHDNKVHSYGGLDARKAIVETIYTHIFGKLLPLGTVNIQGLIFVGEKSGFNGNEDCWGAVMVRDTCIRPGHFLRAGGFIPSQKVKSSLLSDVGRVRRLYKDLQRYFDDASDFIKWIVHCLQNSALQFSFALVVRIAHGTVSPSNISIDGRWLDLPDTGFLGGSTTFSIKNEFFTEHKKVLKYFLELVYNYGKYNQLSLNHAPLVKFYNKQFHAYFRHHVGFAFGFDKKELPFFSSEDWRIVAETYFRTLQLWKNKIENNLSVPSYSIPGENDPVYSLVIGSLLWCLNSALAVEILDRVGFPELELNIYLESFKKVWNQYLVYMKNTYNMDKGAVSICSLLTALKTILWVEVFHLSNVDKRIVNICDDGSPIEVGPLIDNYLNTASWIFNDDENIVTLFRSNHMDVWFSVTGCHYCIEVDGYLSVYKRFNSLYEYLTGVDKERFVVEGHSFFEYFHLLNDIVSSIEV